MAQHQPPPEPRASSMSTALAVIGVMLVMSTLVAGVSVSADALDIREGSRTMAWLLPTAFAGIAALLTAVILRFDSILASLGLRMGAMRDHLPALINTHPERHLT